MYFRLHLKQKCQSGVTLIELMTVVSILAVLLTLAVPSFQSFIASTRLSSAVNDITSSLARARAESIRSGNRVTLCRSNAANTDCSKAAGEGWELGWLMVQDLSRTTIDATVDTGDTITFIGQKLPNDIVIRGNSYSADYVSYAANGQPRQMKSGLAPGTIRVCSTSAALQDSERARDLKMSGTGNITLEKTAVVRACPVPT